MTLSEGGAYVATPLALLPQAQLRVAIQIPELQRTVEVEAVVAWENRGERRPSAQPEGYGLRFIKVPNASGEAIRWLLRKNSRDHAAGPETTRGLSSTEVQEAMKRAEVVAAHKSRESQGIHGMPRSVGDMTTKTLPTLSRPEAEPEPENPPYTLEPVTLQAKVPPSTPGVFILSFDRTMDARIGRADTDLRLALSEFLGKYAYFHFEGVPARKERFERECELYHRLGGDRGQLDNEEHPLPPPGPQLKCPVCVKTTP